MKKGLATTEFWVSVFTSLGPWLTDAVPAHYKLAVSALVSVGYAISRGLAKMHGVKADK